LPGNSQTGRGALIFVILHSIPEIMSLYQPHYKSIPHLIDTTVFFDYYVPFTNQSVVPANDSIKGFYNFSIYDFQTQEAVKVEYKQGPSIFTHHQLSQTTQGPKLIQKQSTDWIAFLVIICLVALAWIQTNYSKRLRQIIRSVALPYYVNQLEREGNLYNERITLGLGSIYLISLSLLIYEASRFFGITNLSLPNFLIYLIVLSGVIGYLIFKALLIQLTGEVFKTLEYVHSYRLNSLIFNHVTGLILFPILLFIIYWQVTPFIWIALFSFSILVLYKFLRSISIGLSNTKFPVFYLILYLCTLEILPLLLLIKAIRQI
jgi:hypothetical protein